MVKLDVTCLLGFLWCPSINTSSTWAQLSLVCNPFGHSCVSLTFLYTFSKNFSTLSEVSSQVSFYRLLFGCVSLCRKSGFSQRWLLILLLPPALPPHAAPSGREKYVSEIIQKYYLYTELIFFSFVLMLKILVFFFLKYFAFYVSTSSVMFSFGHH